MKITIGTDEIYPYYDYTKGGTIDLPRETLRRIDRANREWEHCQGILRKAYHEANDRED